MATIGFEGMKSKSMSAADAAAFIESGSTVAMSGFTGSGYPKAVPLALASRIEAVHAAGGKFRVRVWTGASTGPELDGALAKADGIEFRLPYNSDPIAREKINRGEMEYFDMHLSQVAPMAWQGFLGPIDTAVVEVSGIRPDGSLIPSSSIGNNKTWLDQAKQVILEVNSWQNPALEGMHDIYYGTALPPNRVPIPLVKPDDRIGEAYFRCDPDKVVAVVETQAPDRNLPFSPPDDGARQIAGHLLEFFSHEVAKGRLPANLLPLQSGVGNIANAVLTGLVEGPFDNMTAYTEVIQDGMLDLLNAGKLRMASATAFSLSPEAAEAMNANMAFFRDKLILRPQEISNHPELIRRLGCLAMNGLIEADIYGNVNSTHIMGSRIQNGIGGSGDFARNAYVSIFVTPSTAKKGRDLGDRAAGGPRRPHHPGRSGDRDRAGLGRPAGPVAQAASQGDHRELLPPRLPPGPRGLLSSRPARRLWPAIAVVAEGGAVLAPAVHRYRLDEGLSPIAC